MRNSLLLFLLGALLTVSGPGRLNAQPAGTNKTVQSINPGELEKPIWFEWKAGYGDYSLQGFLNKIKTNFGYDLRASADIPQQMLQVNVPSMKIEAASLWRVLDLYNQIASDYPQIGKWVIHYPGKDWRKPPSAIYLVPPKPTDLEDAPFVRAFNLRYLKEEEQKLLFELIENEAEKLMVETKRGIKASLLRGDVHFHKETGICVATGGKTYVEMVASLIDAFRDGRQGGIRPYTAKPEEKK